MRFDLEVDPYRGVGGGYTLLVIGTDQRVYGSESDFAGQPLVDFVPNALACNKMKVDPRPPGCRLDGRARRRMHWRREVTLI